MTATEPSRDEDRDAQVEISLADYRTTYVPLRYIQRQFTEWMPMSLFLSERPGGRVKMGRWRSSAAKSRLTAGLVPYLGLYLIAHFPDGPPPPFVANPFDPPGRFVADPFDPHVVYIGETSREAIYWRWRQHAGMPGSGAGPHGSGAGARARKAGLDFRSPTVFVTAWTSSSRLHPKTPIPGGIKAMEAALIKEYVRRHGRPPKFQ